MYLAISLIMVIIITAWILHLKNYLIRQPSFSSSPSDFELNAKWEQMTDDLSKIFSNLNQFKESLNQAPTTSLEHLQNAAQISPDELEEVIQKLKIEISTNTTTTTLQ